MDNPTRPSAESASMTDPARGEDSSVGFSWSKAALLAAILAGLVGVYVAFADTLSLDNLATHEAALRNYQGEWYVLVIAILLYVTVTAVSLPGGAVALTLTYGWYFGFAKAIVLVSFASTAGATLAFLLSRYLFRDAIQARFGERLTAFNKNLEEEGAFYLFTLRLIPLVPFFIINLVMGLTPIRTRTFWWVSQIGMLAGTAVYTYAGSSVPSLTKLAEQGPGGIFTPKIAVAFALLGLFPIAVKKITPWLRPAKPASPANDIESQDTSASP